MLTWLHQAPCVQATPAVLLHVLIDVIPATSDGEMLCPLPASNYMSLTEREDRRHQTLTGRELMRVLYADLAPRLRSAISKACSSSGSLLVSAEPMPMATSAWLGAPRVFHTGAASTTHSFNTTYI